MIPQNPIQKALNQGKELLSELTDPVNPILKAHLEGVEQINEKVAHYFGGGSVRFSDIPELKSFLTTYAEMILNAALEAGPIKRRIITSSTEYDNGYNSCRSSFHSAIDEGIKLIK